MVCVRCARLSSYSSAQRPTAQPRPLGSLPWPRELVPAGPKGDHFLTHCRHLPQFQVPDIPSGELPPLTPQQKERALLKKEPDELAEELKGRTFYSDIFNRLPPPEGYFETAVLQPAPPAQKMPPGDTRPRWKYV